jgi:hypothetical protein
MPDEVKQALSQGKIKLSAGGEDIEVSHSDAVLLRC